MTLMVYHPTVLGDAEPIHQCRGKNALRRLMSKEPLATHVQYLARDKRCLWGGQVEHSGCNVVDREALEAQFTRKAVRQT